MNRSTALALIALAFAATAMALELRMAWSGKSEAPRPAIDPGLAQRLETLERKVDLLQSRRDVSRLDALSARMGALERMNDRVNALETSRLNRLAVRDPSAVADPTENSDVQTDVSGDTGPNAQRMRYVEFRSPHNSVTVRQGETGALSVHNTDPRLALRELTINAVRPDGTIDRITVTVPPPQ